MSSATSRDYAAIARQYEADVLADTIPACKWVRLSVQRNVDDLIRQDDPQYPYRYDPTKGDRACRFIASLPNIKGPQTGKPIELQPWQAWIVMTVFSWVSKATGFRRFRRVYIEVPRGNGKSTLSSGIALYMLCADREGGAEVYSAAVSKEQAQIVFGDAQKMLRHEAAAQLRERLGLSVLAHGIHHPKTNSLFRALASENGALDGLATHLSILDELHAHKTREVYDVMETSLGKRTQSLLWAITTAGSNRAGICFEVRDRITKILERVFEEETVFGVVYTIDDKDSWDTVEAARKANPNYGVSVFPDDLAQKLRAAQQQPSKQAAYKTKHLCVWVSTDSAWLDMTKVLRCADETLREEDFAGQPCVPGIDLASKLDLLAYVRVYPRVIDGTLHIYVFGTYYTPEARIEASANSQYRGWAIAGHLQTCPGEVNDYDLVTEAIKSDAKRVRVLEVAVDPYQVASIATTLMKEGLKVVEVPQMPKHLSPAMKAFEAAVASGTFHYNGDPVLTWALSNVVCHEDRNGNYFPNKASAENKIDPATALLTSLNRVEALHATGELGRNPNDREFITVF
jgi:phage terminase large subunit-like protein